MGKQLTIEEKVKLIEEYHNREVRWTTKALDQLSFFNNLLLTLSVGFLSFSYKNFSHNEIAKTCKEINWSQTYTTLSIVFIAFSILVGLLVTLNRLLDFRLTRHIDQVRHRILKHSDELLDESTPKKLDIEKRIPLPFEVIFNPQRISMEECKSFKKMNQEQKNNLTDTFKRIRETAYNLGINTWDKTVVQIALFGFSMLFYFLGIIAG